MLGRRKKVIGGKVVEELAVDSSFHYLHDSWNYRDGPEVRWIGGVAGLEDWVDD